MIERLICLVRGHVARRLNGTFYVVCDRCDATLHLEIDPWWAMLKQACKDARCPAGREHREHRNDAELIACGILN